MKYARFIIAALLLLLPFTFRSFGDEAVKPDATVQEPKPEVKQDAGAPETKQETGHQHAMGKEKTVVATMGDDGVQRAEVVGGEYYFDPNHIVVKVNKPVELTVKKTPGFTPHDMLVKAPEAGIDFKVDLDAKKPEIVKFTPTKVGKYPMYCDKKFLWSKSHRKRGMEGVIEVVE
ncbi:MAG TPA: cupredoxin domain-containing protein [Nitrospirota bacterium]